MIISSSEGVRWVLDSYRDECDSSLVKKAIQALSEQGLKYGHLQAYGDEVVIAASSEAHAVGAFDFATAMAADSMYRKKSRVTYIERIETDGSAQWLLVEIESGVPKRSFTVSSEREVVDEVSDTLQADNPNELVAFDMESLFDSKGWVFDGLDAPLSETLKTVNQKPYCLLEDIELDKKKSPLKFAILGVVALAVLWGVWSLPAEKTVQVEQPIAEVDRWASYREALTTNSIFAYERLLQDLAFHRLFEDGPGANGWVIEGVEVAHNGQTYRLSRNEGGQDRALTDFVRHDDVVSVVGEPVLHLSDRATTMQVRGRNRPLPFAASNHILSVDELQTLFSEAVSAYMPNSELRFIQDRDQGVYVGRELELRFRGVFWEDLIGFAAMTRDYPLSMGRVTGDSAIGGYGVTGDNRILTGSLFITLVGETHE